jgi:hypothetical protein
MKWTDEQLKPATDNRTIDVQTMLAELETQPGRWAEIARYDLARRTAAYSRGSMNAKRHKERRLQYSVARDGDEYVLFYRIAP